MNRAWFVVPHAIYHTGNSAHVSLRFDTFIPATDLSAEPFSDGRTVYDLVQSWQIAAGELNPDHILCI
eukprot:5146436-Lingulodinium_polyedra.AAC.1